MSRYMNLTIIEVRGPDRILARETPGPTASAETVEYALLFKEMNDYFNNGILTFEIHSPKPNEICVAQNSQNNRWHRVRVEEILMTLSGPKANCFFLDTGEKHLIRVVKIQKIPQRFLTVPFQVKVFALYGLRPLSLVVDPMLTAFQMPCKKWDTSAAVHIKKLINCASSIQAVIKSRGEESELLAMIYLRFSSNEILSLNEELIDKGYAIKDPVINKSFGEETKNFVQNVFQTNGSLSPKVEQHEHPTTKFDSLQSLNGFYRRSNANNSPAPVRVSSQSDIPEKNCSDDFGNLSPISSNSSRNSSFLHPSEPNSFSNSEECQKIPWKSLSPNPPSKTSVDQPVMTDACALNQLLSYHKKLQQNNPIIEESGSLKASVSYQMPNLESENTLTAVESPNCNHDIPVSSIESDSSSTTEESEMSYDSEEKEENAISSSVISTNINSKIISKLSPVKSSSQDVTSNSTTGNLTNFLAYHKKLINSNQETVPTESTSKTLDRSSNISATKIQLTTEDDKINQLPNNFPVSSSVQIQARHKRPNTRAHDRQSVSKIGSHKSPQPVISQSSFIHRHSFTDSNNSDKSRCFEKTKPSLPFHRTQPIHGDMSLHCNQVKQFPLVPVFSESASTNTRNMKKQTSMPFNKIQPKYDGAISNIGLNYNPVKKSPHTPVLLESASANSKNMEKQPNLLFNRIQPKDNYNGSISDISSHCDPVKTSPYTPVLFESVSTNSKNSVEKRANMLFNKIQPEDDDDDGSISNIGAHCDPVKKSPHTPMFYKSASTNSKNSMEKEPSVLFSRIQSEDDDDRPISALSLYCNQLKKSQYVPAFLDSDSTDSENVKPKFFQSSENLSSTNNSVISNEADIAANKILCIREEEIANRLNPNSACLIHDSRHNEKDIPSESEKCTNFQSNSKEATSPFSHFSLTTSAITMLNFSVSSKLLSSSSANTIRMLQGLNTLPLNKLNSCENGNPSGSEISKKFQTFTNIDDSDLSEIELDNTSNFQTENNTREIIKNKRNATSSDNSKLLIQSQEFSNSECLSGFCDLSTVLPSNSKDVAHNFVLQSEIQGIQQDGTSRKADSIFEKMENHSLHKIENLPEIVTTIPNLKQDFTPIADIKSTPNEIGRLRNENDEKAGKAESFELLTNESQNATPLCVSTNMADKMPTMISDSTNCCKNTPTSAEVCEEKMKVNILPPSNTCENDIFSVKTVPTNGSDQIISRCSSEEVGTFKSNESENDKYNPFLKYFEQSHENDFFSSVNFVSNSNFNVQSISTNLSSNEKETSCTSLSYAVQSTVASSATANAAVPIIDQSYAADDKEMASENKETPSLTAVLDAVYCRKIAPGFDLSSEVDNNKARLVFPCVSREVDNTEISPSTNLLFETDNTEIEPSTVMSSKISNSEIDLSSKVDNNEIVPAFGLSSKMEISPCIDVAFEEDNNAILSSSVSSEVDNPEILGYAGVSFEVDKTEILEPTVASPEVNKTKIFNPIHIASEMNNTKILRSTCFSSEVDNTEILGDTGICSEVDNTKILEPIATSKVDNTEILGFTSVSSEVDNIEALRYTGVSSEVDITKVLGSTSVSSEVDNTELLGSTGVSSEMDITELLPALSLSSEVDNTELVLTGLSLEVDDIKTELTDLSYEIANTEILGSTSVASNVDIPEVLEPTNVSSEVDNTEILEPTNVSSEAENTEIALIDLSSEVDNTKIAFINMSSKVDNMQISPSTGVSCSDDNAGTSPSSGNEISAYSIVSTVDCDGSVECDVDNREYTYDNVTSSSVLSFIKHKEISSNMSVDIENIPALYKSNIESPSLIKELVPLNESMDSLSKTDNENILKVEDKMKPIRDERFLAMPALESVTDDSNSGFLSSSENEDALSKSSSVGRPDDAQESADSCVKEFPDNKIDSASLAQPIPKANYKMPLSSINDETEEFDSVISDQNCNPILCFPFSPPNDPQPVLPSVDDISGVMLPELSNSVSLSDSVHNELDDTIPVEQCAGIDLCENNDLHLEATHTVSGKERQSISASTTDENNLVVSPLNILSHLPQQEEMKHSTNPAVSISPTPVSLEQMIKSKDQSSNSARKSLSVRDHTMDCIRGRRILEKLGVTKKANITQKNPEQLTTESILLNDSVLFVAETIPNPIYNLQEFGVPEALFQLTENLNINPTPIQAYSWGPALRGKNIIGISPLGSGKTWAYLVPILASLCQYNIYSDIKFSNGPFVLILVSTWTKAISVYKQCKHLSQSNREIIIEIVYGGGEESKKSVNLLNGCHVLVATLPCFKRMFDSKFTSLDRLCHLVIDDADILLQDFYKEIVDLMCKYKNLVESRDKGYQRHQVMAYSSKWTSYIKGFVNNAVCDPVIIITDMMEAAIYGGVKQIPIMCEESDRNDQLVKLVPQILKKGEKVIVFSLDADCVELQNILVQHLKIPVAVACNSLYKSELEIVAAEWKLPLSEDEPYRVLVSSDTALCDLLINDATCVVHYRMPKKKIHIGLRIQTMSNCYQHYKNDQPPVKIVNSYILIIPENKKQVKSLRSFLMRSINVTNKETWDFLSNIRQDEDLNHKIKLCLNLKAFGKCRNKYQCNDRHCVVPSVDLNGTSSQHICLPTQGDVRVKILHVKTANNFYVRILEHKNGLHKSIQNHSDLATLIMELAFYYNNHSNRLALDELKAGTLCVVNTSEQFSRVKVVQPYDNAAKNTASLFFVDIGKLESHPICNLYQLADEFKVIPFQAVEVFLCRLRPVDFDTEWTPASNSFAESWLESKILYGKIRFVMDNTMWLDPLLKRTFLKAIKTVTNGPSLRRELISNNLAVDNPQHLIQLHQLFEGYVPKLIPLNNRQSSCSSWEFLLENETLQTPADDYENVVISYIFNPEHFYVQKIDMKICFNDLMMKIEEKMKVETEQQQKRDWCVGMHCLSKSLLDSRWYRVIILTLMDSNAVVHFVDYGNIEEVPIDELRTIPRELMYLPSQAIECKLAHIKPFEDQWSTKSSDMMYYMTQTVNNVYKTLALHVDSEIPTDGKLPQYCVTLLDTSYERVMNIGQELVWWKMAASNDDHFQTLFPEEQTLQMFSPSAGKIADMCAVLYTEQTSSQQYDQLMTSYLKVCLKYPEKLLEENVPGCLLKLFSYTHNTEMFSSVLEYIKLLLAKPSLYGNLLSCGILQNLGQILKMHDDENVLHKTFQLIQFMIKIDSTLIKTITSFKSGLFSIICEILKSSYANEIKISACQLLESFCLVDTKCSENLIQLQVCPILLPDVLEMQDHDFLEAYLSLLDPLSQSDSGLVAIKREKPMEEIMKIIEAAKCEKCVCKCLIALKRLSNQNRKNKTLLLELNAVAILSSCQNLLTGTEAAPLCQELLDGLVVKVHHNNSGNRVSVCSQLQSINERNFSVLWCQNKFRILITVKIPKLEWSDCKFQKTSLHFSLISNDGIKQSVNYELFDEVIVEKCAVCLQNKEAIISLCKTEVGYWPRLLQDKFNKPSNLSVDFDKIESDDSDSEEVEADEKNPFTLQVVVKEPVIKLVRKKLPSDEEEIPLPVDPTESEDSLENSDFEEYDRFNIFNTK